ncbi:MAG: methyltransferase domain-containing protein [Deltaproteobacteria bacterium]|nr:MAG: methyltransferase domain-containing protein [Deltaproteobacteria bacterium]
MGASPWMARIFAAKSRRVRKRTLTRGRIAFSARRPVRASPTKFEGTSTTCSPPLRSPLSRMMLSMRYSWVRESGPATSFVGRGGMSGRSFCIFFPMRIKFYRLFPREVRSLDKERVREEFSRRADLYGVSPDHVEGADLRFLDRYLSSRGVGERGLDVSTGAGHTAGVISRHCRVVVAFDISEGMLQEARERYGGEGIYFVQGDAESLPFRDGVFDVVTCRIAPHHFPQVERFVREVRRVLTRRGVAVIVDSTVPPLGDLDAFINRMEKLRDPTHVRSLTVFQWRNLFSRAGLRLLEEWTFRKRHDFPSWLDRTKPSPGAREEVISMLKGAPEEVKEYLRLEFSPAGEVLAYEDEKTLFVVAREKS